MELDEPDHMVLKREKKSKKKNRDANDLVNVEAKGMAMQDTGVETKEECKQKKKRGTGNKSDKDTENDNGLVNVMILEDNGVEIEEDDKKKRKRGKRENKDEDNYLQDTNVNGEDSAGEKNKDRKKHEKNKKSQCKQLVKEQASDLEFAFIKEDKKRKKENRKKVQKGEDSCDGECEAPGTRSHMGIEMSNESLSKDKRESNYDELELEVRKDKSKQKKEKKKKKYEAEHSSATSLCENQNHKDVRENSDTDKKDFSSGVEIEEEYTINGVEKETKERKKKKKKKEKQGGDFDSLSVNTFDQNPTKDKKRQNIASDEERNTRVHVEGGGDFDSDNLKKRKKHKKSKHDTEGSSGETIEMQLDVDRTAVDDIGNSLNEAPSGSVGKKKRKRDREEGILNAETEKMSKRKKGKPMKDVEEKGFDEGKISTKSKEESADYSNLKPKRPSKRVRFSDKVEIFPSSDGRDSGKKTQDGLVRGRWFSPEEDTILKDAVFNYIREHDLGEDGVKKVLNSKSYPETKNCWKEISSCMPYRPLKCIYHRVHNLFERSENRSWTPEELELVKKFHAQHGPNWKMLADEMDKSRIHVKDTWRRICLPNRNRGPWTQEEYQKLFDLVNMDLRMKVFEEKKVKHGMLRDNIAWEAISQKLSTRTNMECCRKWYTQLESPLVREGKWASSDDFRLLDELIARDYSALDEVDWDDLLDHRPGDVCQKRWRQMVNHLGLHGNKAFADQVEVLRQRYCPDVLEAREEYENKVAIDADDI